MFGALAIYGDQDAGFSGLATIEDFDGDGNLDVVAWNSTKNEVVIMLGTGDGGLVEGSRYAIGQRPARVIAADFDVDGHLDLAVPSFETRDTVVLMGVGDGTFEVLPRILDTSAYVVAGDLDGDGIPELIGGGFKFLNVGSNRVQRVELGGMPERIVVFGTSDMNRDGILDLVIWSGDDPDDGVVVALGDGEGGFEQVSYAWIWVAEAAVADLNADGAPDFIGVSASEDDVAVLLNQCPRPACPADIDASGAVDFGDVLAVVSAWGACPPSGACPADIDGATDGVVDLNDLLLVLASWGPC